MDQEDYYLLPRSTHWQRLGIDGREKLRNGLVPAFGIYEEHIVGLKGYRIGPFQLRAPCRKNAVHLGIFALFVLPTPFSMLTLCPENELQEL
jgi:hypothetical protein